MTLSDIFINLAISLFSGALAGFWVTKHYRNKDQVREVLSLLYVLKEHLEEMAQIIEQENWNGFKEFLFSDYISLVVSVKKHPPCNQGGY